LNQLQADAVSYTDDIASDSDATAAQRKRVSADNWQSIPEFKFQPATSGELLRSAMPAAAMLMLWLVVALILLAPASRHVGRAIR
jgi:ABC-2 type transport system permease protein